MTKMQTNIGDLKRQIEDLHSITNANIARLQNLLVIGANFKNLTYRQQLNYRDSLALNGSYIRDHIRESASKIDKVAFDIFLSTRHNSQARSELEMLAKIEEARANKTPAKDIPFSVFKAMVTEEGIPVDDRNKLIRERGDKRFKELL